MAEASTAADSDPTNSGMDAPDRTAAPAVDRRITLTVRLARALHRYGTPAHELEESMLCLLDRLGLDGRLMSMPTGILAGFGAAEEQRTTLIRADPGEVDLGKLARLYDLMVRLINEPVHLEDALLEVDRIEREPPRYSRLVNLCFYAVAAASVARLLGGSWREISVSAVIGLATGLLALGLAPTERTRRILEIASAVVAGAAAELAAHLLFPARSFVISASGLIVLIPGLMITNAVTELSTRNLVSGTARLTGSLMIFLQLGFGAALGGGLAGLLSVPALRGVIRPEAWSLWPALVLAPLSFAVLLRARPRDLLWAVFAAFFSFGGARLGSALIGPTLGIFVGAVIVGIATSLMARLLRRPTTVFLVPAILFLIPGSFGFGSASSFFERDLTDGITIGVSLMMASVALVSGLLVAKVLLPERGLSLR